MYLTYTTVFVNQVSYARQRSHRRQRSTLERQPRHHHQDQEDAVRTNLPDSLGPSRWLHHRDQAQRAEVVAQVCCIPLSSIGLTLAPISVCYNGPSLVAYPSID